MRLLKNSGTDRVVDELRRSLAPGGTLDIATPAFSLFAFADLQDALGRLDGCRGAGTLLACLAPQIAAGEVEALALGIAAWHKEVATAGETLVVFRDSAFADDVAKSNLTAILQQHGQANVRSL